MYWIKLFKELYNNLRKKEHSICECSFFYNFRQQKIGYDKQLLLYIRAKATSLDVKNIHVKKRWLGNGFEGYMRKRRNRKSIHGLEHCWGR